MWNMYILSIYFIAFACQNNSSISSETLPLCILKKNDNDVDDDEDSIDEEIEKKNIYAKNDQNYYRNISMASHKKKL